MIARVWSGRTRAADAERFAATLSGTGVPDLAKRPGNRGVLVLRRVEGDQATFQVLSLWESEDDVRRVADEDPEGARMLLGAGSLEAPPPASTGFDLVQAIWHAGLRVDA